MKKLLLLLSFLLSFVFGFSQNLGIVNENNVLKISYVSYINGVHTYLLKSKVNCGMRVKLDKNNNFIEHDMAPLEEMTVLVTGVTSVNFKAKKEQGGECITAPDAGWVEHPSPVVLPVKMTNVIITKINPSLIKLSFRSEEDINISSYNILMSQDGKTFKKAQILFPNGITGTKTYSVLIKL